MPNNKKLGDILIEHNILCAKVVERVVAISKKLNKRFGAVLEEMGLVTEEELVHALALQYNMKPVFDFAKVSFSPEVLGFISAAVALENTIFPLKRDMNRLALALADPTQTKIIANIAANNNLVIVPYISTTTEIRKAIGKHYFGKDIAAPVKNTILIVEDDTTLLSVLRDTLSKHYQVITAVDGLEAYKEVISKKPHVILTDKEMPKLDGFGLLNALRAVPGTKQIPIILISGTTSAEAEAQAFEKGFFDFIPKPVKETTLLTRVKRAFEFSEKQQYLFLR
jgi:CheY-like chemotaxis protein